MTLDKLRSVILGICVIVILLGILAYLLVRTGSGGDFFGDSQGTLKPINFAVLHYNPSQPGYLVCDKSVCPASIADEDIVRINMPVQGLRGLLLAYVDDNQTARTHSFDISSNQFTFTERVREAKYPVVMTAQIIPDGASSQLVLYSYSPLGELTSKDHEKRTRRWLEHIYNRAKSG